ncbi:DUF1127 domain-containing protein [Phaeobacter sp. HF9A]|nr:DUF1127 domain-containing protein [Phaeobacter sp. HF9A]
MTHVTEHTSHLAYLTSRQTLPMAAAAAVHFAVLVTKWSVRKRTRRQLTRLEAAQLRDIGIDRVTALREGTLPFWRP